MSGSPPKELHSCVLPDPYPTLYSKTLKRHVSQRKSHPEASTATGPNADQRTVEQPEYEPKVVPRLSAFLPYVEKEMDRSIGHTNAKRSFNLAELVQDWLDTCDQLHHGRCGPHGLAETNGPLLLIDVQDNCLVTAPPAAHYVALSYVWGNPSASACTTKENVARLKQANGLNHFGDLPRTIKDTISFVRQLGVRYLWCDRFCIIQDEGVGKEAQLNDMGNIYARSYFTIVATQGNDASSKLYEERPPLNIKRKARMMSWLGWGKPVKSSPTMSGQRILLNQAQNLMRTKWYSRAWTCQEYLFSKRRVVFQNDTVNWECLDAAWHKLQDMSRAKSVMCAAPKSSISHHIEIPLSGFTTSPWPDMSRYARLVSLFNQRKLTYPEDVLQAFAGVLSHLSRTFSGGFISGLPQLCFDAALLWQPWVGMPRRVSVGPASEAVLPSWSWVGWAGDVNSESWRSAANYLLETSKYGTRERCSWKTSSTVAWSYSLTQLSPREKINSCITCPQQSFAPEMASSGWSKVWNPNFEGEHVYYHACDPPQLFLYPIPIQDQSVAHTSPVSARYLHCTTTRAFLTAGSAFNSHASMCICIDLLIPKTNTWAGVLRLNHSGIDEVDMPAWVGALLSNDDPENAVDLPKDFSRKAVELIEMSAGSVENHDTEAKSFDEWGREECRRKRSFHNLYEFYNVLWIEWVDGVAYRKALGRVEKLTWEAIEKERIEVVLG